MSKWHLLVTDLHSGSAVSVLPDCFRKSEIPKSRKPDNLSLESLRLYNEAVTSSGKLYHEFQSVLEALPQVDYMYLGGDMTDGNIDPSELAESNLGTQPMIASSLLKEIHDSVGCPKNVFAVCGTPAHSRPKGTGLDLDREAYNLFGRCRAVEEDTLFAECNGTIVRLRHTIGRSGTPYGKQTPLSREMVVNTLASEADTEHDADVMLFGHVHYCVGSSFPISKKYAYTGPTLKMKGEAYGRKFSGQYDVGLLLFEQIRYGDPWIPRPITIPVAYKMPELHKEKVDGEG